MGFFVTPAVKRKVYVYVVHARYEALLPHHLSMPSLCVY